jgi:single-strand DNA-binding protein
MLNKVILLGVVDSTIDFRATKTGTQTANLRLKTWHESKGKTYESWHNVVVFGDSVNKLSMTLKGAPLYVEGSVKTRKYTDRQGAVKYMTEVNAYVVETVANLQAPVQQQQVQQQPMQQTPAQQYQQQMQQPAQQPQPTGGFTQRLGDSNHPMNAGSPPVVGSGNSQPEQSPFTESDLPF